MFNLWSTRHHRAGNAGKNHYFWRYSTSWIDECLKCPKLFAALILDSADFGDPVAASSATSCFEIKNAEGDFV